MTHRHIFFFIPNIVGYLRIILYATSFIAHAIGNWVWCFLLYLIAFLLDELDGLTAKRLNQSTQFGATLDMVTDRAATTGFCMVLSQIYPAYLLVFILLIALDISSHYYLLQAASTQAESNHKNIEHWSNNRLLNLYYGNKQFMDTVIVGNELFYMLLYLSYHLRGTEVFTYSSQICHLLLWITVPLYLLKQVINIVQLQASATCIAIADVQKR